MESLTNSLSKYVGFSYHQNQKELLLKISNYLKNANIPVWIDMENETTNDKMESLNRTVENLSVLVCFLTPMFQSSQNCQDELEVAKSAGIPIIGCHLLPNWKPSGWLNKIVNDSFTVDLRGINQKNFQVKIKKLRDKIIRLLDDIKNSQIISDSFQEESFKDQSTFLEDSNIFSLVNDLDLNCSKKSALKYRQLPHKCSLNLSNLMVCSNEYILIHGNNNLHLFDGNLKLVRSTNDIKINERHLKDFCWCSDPNAFLILTKKQIYLMNPLTCKLSIIETMKLKDQSEEFLSFCCFQDRLFLITTQSYTNSFYLEQYNLPTFRFYKKYSLNDLIGTNLFIQNGFFIKNDLQQILSIRYFQKKLVIIMEISFKWFISIFNLYEQPHFLTKIPLEERSRITVLHPIHQAIIYKDFLSDSFIQISMDFRNLSTNNQLEDFLKGSIHFNGKLHSVALFGMSNLVLLTDNALLLYKL